MDRDTALNTLRLPIDANRSQIITAYSRLARRYPLQQFPERHTLLLEAKSVLLNPEIAFKEILTEDIINLSWLDQYSTTKETKPHDEPINPKQCLEALLRPHLINGSQIFPSAFGPPSEIAEMMKAFGPEGIEELMEKLGPEGIENLMNKMGV